MTYHLAPELSDESDDRRFLSVQSLDEVSLGRAAESTFVDGAYRLSIAGALWPNRYLNHRGCVCGSSLIVLGSLGEHVPRNRAR